ncbi:MAG: CHAT domain-containing protein [Gemmatimonadaceae bacterium]|nr:CHAT domain-containing protein [Gemmatimonadaceae bacterium]
MLSGSVGQAVLAQSTDPRQIVESARRAGDEGTLDAFIRRWRQAPPTTDRRSVALAIGSASRLTYDFRDAERRLRIAEGDTVHPDALTAQAALGRATIELQQFNLRRAEPLLRRAIQLSAAGNAPDVTAEAMVLLVPVRQRLLGVPAALATADSVAAMLRPNDSLLRTELRCRRAQARIRAGDPAALDEARRGVSDAARLPAPRLEGLCWQAVGQSHQMRDELREASAAFGHAAERHAAGHDQAGVAASLQWRGFFRRVLGQFDSAQTDYRRAIEAGTTSGNRAPVAWAWLGLSGLSLAAGEPVRAADEAQRARRIMLELGDRWGLASVASLAGMAAHQLGDLPRARERFREAIARSDSLGALSDEMVPAIRLIDVERELDGEPAAFARLAMVDTLAARTGIPRWAGQRWYHLALLALRRGDGTAALDHLRRFETTFQRGDTSTLPGFDYTVRLAEAHALAGDPLRGARLLAGAIDDFARWRRRLGDRALRLAVWDERALDPDPDLGIATIIARAAAAGHDTLAYRLADARRARDLRLSFGEDTPRTLAPDQVMLQFVTGRRGEPTTLFIRRGTTLRSTLLPPIDSLARRIVAFRSLIAGDAAATVLSRELGTLLLGPASAVLDTTIRTVLIVPDGALHGVPWSALTLPDGALVLDRAAVAVLASGAAPVLARRIVRPGPSVAIGVTDGAPAWDGVALPALPRARREAEDVAAAMRGGHALVGNAATERAVKQLHVAPPWILHIAAHAIVDERSASRAAIVLRAGDGDDGLLDANELAAMQLPVELLVLSGCSTASGRVLAADGVQGLLRPLRDAGVRNVVASQWAVRDAAAQQIMRWFYAGLAADLPTAVALREAQRRARRAGFPPGDWASWTYVGEPSARVGDVVAITTSHRERWIAGLAATSAALALALGWYYRRSRRRAGLRS